LIFKHEFLLWRGSSQRKLSVPQGAAVLNQSATTTFIKGETMKKLLFIMIAAFAFNAIPVVYADEALPEVAPVDEPAPPPLTVDQADPS